MRILLNYVATLWLFVFVAFVYITGIANNPRATADTLGLSVLGINLAAFFILLYPKRP